MKKITIALYLLIVPFISNAQTGLPFDVQHYRFEIALSDSTDVIQGKAFITIKAIQPIGTVTLDLGSAVNKKGMLVSSVADSNQTFNYSQKNDKLIINLGRTVVADSIISFQVRYAGTPGDGLIIAKNKFGSRTFFSDNWPNRAHHWLPCVDHPADKASVEFIITAPNHYQVISNGVQVEETDLPGNKKLTHWKEEVPLPTKIMVIGVARFAVQHVGDTAGIPVYSWVYPENRKEGFYDYAPAKDILPFFIDYIGPYAYKKLANVQSKTMFGGMENASAIFYSEGSVTGKRTIEGLLAHEIAHQWFGNSATEKNFSHVWLSEGFATYFTNLYMEAKYGAEKMKEMLIQQRKEVIAFSKKNNRPVIDTGSNLMQLLNANSYQKGAWVLHMLRGEVGDDAFQKIIRRYYERYAGKNAESENLRAVAEEVSGKNLKQFFYQWLEVPGQPDITISWKYEEARREVQVTVVQKQNIIFQFPLNLQIKNADGESPNHSVRIDKKQQTFSFQVKQRPLGIDTDAWVALLWEINSVQRD